MKSRWHWVGLAILAIAAGWALAQLLAGRTPPPGATGTLASAGPLQLTPQDVIAVQARELVRPLPITGTLVAVSTANVKAKVATEVARVTVREGEAVQAGQLLAQLETTELKAKWRQAHEQVTAARAQADIAQRTLANTQALLAQGFISRNALDTANANAASANANVLAAAAALDLTRKSLEDASVYAPITGTIAHRHVQPGERVSVDAKLLDIVDLSHMEWEAALDPTAVGEVRIGMSATVHTDGTDTPLQATVARINPATEPGTRAVKIYLTVPPHPALRQGLFASGALQLSRDAALVVPTSAVREALGTRYVLKVEADRITRQAVETGLQGEVDNQAMVAIRRGLEPGALVLTSSVGSLPEGAAVKLPDALHR